MLRAVIAVVAEKGYAASTIADVVGAARVSREVFYAHFAGKEECFVEACDDGCELMFDRVAQAQRSEPVAAGPVPLLAAGVRAYLRFLLEEPEFARAFLLEALAAGPLAVERRRAVHGRFAAMTRTWHDRARSAHPEWPAAPDEAYLAVVGAFHELVAERLREERPDRLLDLEPPIMHIHLALFAGCAAAGAADKARTQ